MRMPFSPNGLAIKPDLRRDGGQMTMPLGLNGSKNGRVFKVE